MTTLVWRLLMSIKRRLFLKLSFAGVVILALYPWLRGRLRTSHGGAFDFSRATGPAGRKALGADANGLSRVYLARYGSPSQNMQRAMQMSGGIEKFVAPDDIVVLKVNSQGANQGTTNTDNLQGLIDLILASEDFRGEIIVADNHQFDKDDSRGWNTELRNGRYNLNELIRHYQDRGHANVTKYHWRVAGSCAYPLEANGQGDSRISGPEEGDGYVWLQDEYFRSPSGRRCLLTYPVFTSAYSGIRIDLRRGAWRDGRYMDDRRVRFFNVASLNHHGRYCGVTASVKNLMGVVDMTCGFPGDLHPETYNTHHIGVSRKKHWLHHGSHWRVRAYRGWLRYRFEDYCYRNFHHTGGVLGALMARVRMPDLHIIAAETVGWGDRRDTERAFRPQAVLMSTDPVALDYVAARDILLPGTPAGAKEVSGVPLRELNDPDDPHGPFARFLQETWRQGIGNLDPTRIEVVRDLG